MLLVVDVLFGSLAASCRPLRSLVVISLKRRQPEGTAHSLFGIFYTDDRPTDDNIDIGFPLSFLLVVDASEQILL
jgi:hypothetical protein